MMSYATGADGVLTDTESNEALRVTYCVTTGQKDLNKANRTTRHQGGSQDNRSLGWREEDGVSGGGGPWRNKKSQERRKKERGLYTIGEQLAPCWKGGASSPKTIVTYAVNIRAATS